MNEKTETLHELCKSLFREIEEISDKVSRDGMSAGDLETVDKLTHSLKSVKATIAMMDGEDGYSNRYPMYYYEGDGGNSNRSYRGGSYRDGMSNRGRDSMGRFTSRRGYSRADEQEEFVENLRELMEQAPDDTARQSIQRMIQKMERE